MAHSPSIEFDHAARGRLLTLARHVITQGCGRAVPESSDPAIASAMAEPALAQPRNCFVTLLHRDALRGCIGSLSPSRPLAFDVAVNAYNAGFRDPRFPAVGAAELVGIEIQIAVLSPQQPLAATDEAALLASLRPQVDGLTLEDGEHRATFLPKVWEQLPEPQQFLHALRLKAGLPAGHWSPTLRFSRYHAENFSESEERAAAQ